MKRASLAISISLASLAIASNGHAEEPIVIEPDPYPPAPVPEPAPAPVYTPPKPRPRRLFASGDIWAGYQHASVFDVGLRMFEIGGGAGFVVQRPHQFGFELRNDGVLWLGRTEAGRSLTGFTLRPAGIFRYEWIAFGGYLRIGFLSAKRSTGADAQTDILAGVGLLAEIQPVEIPGFPIFVQAHLDTMLWGNPTVNGVGIDLGIRFCGAGCGF